MFNSNLTTSKRYYRLHNTPGRLTIDIDQNQKIQVKYEPYIESESIEDLTLSNNNEYTSILINMRYYLAFVICCKGLWDAIEQKASYISDCTEAEITRAEFITHIPTRMKSNILHGIVADTTCSYDFISTLDADIALDSYTYETRYGREWVVFDVGTQTGTLSLRSIPLFARNYSTNTFICLKGKHIGTLMLSDRTTSLGTDKCYRQYYLLIDCNIGELMFEPNNDCAELTVYLLQEELNIPFLAQLSSRKYLNSCDINIIYHDWVFYKQVHTKELDKIRNANIYYRANLIPYKYHADTTELLIQVDNFNFSDKELLEGIDNALRSLKTNSSIALHTLLTTASIFGASLLDTQLVKLLLNTNREAYQTDEEAESALPSIQLLDFILDTLEQANIDKLKIAY